MEAIPHQSGTRLPDIDCVLIGVNCAKTLGRCIESILESDYPHDRLHIRYVDGGSGDDSIATARRYAGVSVVALNPEFPTPGLQRNHGWKSGNAPFVQFLDSDTILDPRWLRKAIDAMQESSTGAVNGFRREMHPESTVYNWIGDIEWNGRPGESDCFGGDVLVRRSALDATGGYDETLVGGEDPELSRRIIRAGWRIYRLDALMTRHDLAMTTVNQYLRRAFRSGYGFAAVRSREAKAGSTFWGYDARKITIKAGGFLLLQLLGLTVLSASQSVMQIGVGILFSAAGMAMLFSPRLFRIEKFMREYELNRMEAKRYAVHCSIVVIPQFAGMVRFYAGNLFNRPLRNKGRNLKTALSTPVS